MEREFFNKRLFSTACHSYASVLLCNRYDSNSMQEEAKILQNGVLSYDPYGPARAFIAKLLRKSPYEGRTRWREQGRKKPSGPARIAYGPHTGIFSIVLQ